MSDVSSDRREAEMMEREVRVDLENTMAGAARISEFTVETPLEARPPLTSEGREVAVALNTMCDLLRRRASEASAEGEPRWEGLADGATMLENELCRLGLPQLMRGVLVDV